MYRVQLTVISVLLAYAAGFIGTLRAAPPDGKAIYEKTCAACHATGIAGAPKIDDTPAWKERHARGGLNALFDSATDGKNAMPPKGGNSALSKEEVYAAVMYIVMQSGATVAESPGAPTTAAATPEAEGAANEAGQKPVGELKAVAAAAPKPLPMPDKARGKAVYVNTCAPCHGTGLAGAPKFGDADAWAPRIKAGIAVLYQSALKGKNAMPAKGGNAALAAAEVKAAVDYMVARVKGGAAAKPPTAAQRPVPAAAAEKAAGGPVETDKGKAVYLATCAVCHGTGLAGAPKIGDAGAWAPRIQGGVNSLYASALKGKNAMPAKGGNTALADAEVKAAVDYMAAQSGGTAPAASSATLGQTQAAVTPANATVANAAPTSDAPPAAAQPAPVTAAATDPNAFNRLLRPPGKRNRPPPEDGIHDPANDGTHILQAPLHSFATLPKSNSGNQVDWVKALNEGKINPRMDKIDASVEPLVLDMNIVREVKGSMPDVVYPHRQHTQWLDCSNCHPAIFIPQKGANQMSMAAILLGQKCGVCHGKVAFPVSECRLCHSKNKEPKVSEAKQ